jgi:hypothetical protein
MKSNTERDQADEIMDKLLEDSEFHAVLERKLGELGSSQGLMPLGF